MVHRLGRDQMLLERPVSSAADHPDIAGPQPIAQFGENGPRVASEQKMRFSKAVAKLSNSAMACLSSVRLDFPCCKNQPQKSELLQ